MNKTLNTIIHNSCNLLVIFYRLSLIFINSIVPKINGQTWTVEFPFSSWFSFRARGSIAAS